MDLVKVLRKIDSEDIYPIIDAYYIHTLDMEIRTEHGPDYLVLYVPDVYQTAPHDVLEMLLKAAYASTVDGMVAKRTTDRLRTWVYSPEFIRAYRALFKDFNSPFVNGEGMVANKELTQCAREALNLLPEYRKDLFMLAVTERRRGLDLTRYPVASTSIPGLIITIDPALLNGNVPRVLVKFAIFHEMVRIVNLVGGLIRDTNIGRRQAIERFMDRFDGLEKVRRAYVKLGWTLDQCPLDGCSARMYRITGRAVLWDPPGDGDEDGLQEGGPDEVRTEPVELPSSGPPAEDG